MEEEITPIGMLGWSPPASFDGYGGGVAPVRWTIDLYVAAMKAEILYEGARMELIHGQIVQLAECPSPRYYYIVGELTRHLCAVFGDQCRGGRGVVRVLDDTELEPEALVTRQGYDHFWTAHPTPEDVLLVGEVAETTHAFLLGYKALVYAQAGIPEYWVVDIVARRLVVFRDPANGRYPAPLELTGGDTVSPLAAPGVVIAVSDLLPPLAARSPAPL